MPVSTFATSRWGGPEWMKRLFTEGYDPKGAGYFGQKYRYRGESLYGPGAIAKGGDPNVLRDIMERLFMPEMEARRGQSARLWQDYYAMGQKPLGSIIQPQLEQMGETFSQRLLEPRGELATKFQQAVGGQIRGGWDPTASGQTEETRFGLGKEFTDRLAQYYSAATPQLLGAELGLRGQVGQMAAGYDEVLASMFPSLFTGAAAAENLAFQKWALLKQL